MPIHLQQHHNTPQIIKINPLVHSIRKSYQNELNQVKYLIKKIKSFRKKSLHDYLSQLDAAQEIAVKKIQEVFSCIRCDLRKKYQNQYQQQKLSLTEQLQTTFNQLTEQINQLKNCSVKPIINFYNEDYKTRVQNLLEQTKTVVDKVNFNYQIALQQLQILLDPPLLENALKQFITVQTLAENIDIEQQRERFSKVSLGLTPRINKSLARQSQASQANKSLQYIPNKYQQHSNIEMSRIQVDSNTNKHSTQSQDNRSISNVVYNQSFMPIHHPHFNQPPVYNTKENIAPEMKLIPLHTAPIKNKIGGNLPPKPKQSQLRARSMSNYESFNQNNNKNMPITQNKAPIIPRPILSNNIIQNKNLNSVSNNIISINPYPHNTDNNMKMTIDQLGKSKIDQNNLHPNYHQSNNHPKNYRQANSSRHNQSSSGSQQNLSNNSSNQSNNNIVVINNLESENQMVSSKKPPFSFEKKKQNSNPMVQQVKSLLSQYPQRQSLNSSKTAVFNTNNQKKKINLSHKQNLWQQFTQQLNGRFQQKLQSVIQSTKQSYGSSNKKTVSKQKVGQRIHCLQNRIQKIKRQNYLLQR